MGDQTCGALRQRKINSWLEKGIITKQQHKDIVSKCYEFGFWDALGYATRLKYKTKPANKKYEYKWVKFSKKDCYLTKYITHGAFSGKHQKRYRSWRNPYYLPDGKTERMDELKKQYPKYDIFFLKHGSYVAGLRREVGS